MRLLPRMFGVEAQVGIGMKDGGSGKPAVRKSDLWMVLRKTMLSFACASQSLVNA